MAVKQMLLLLLFSFTVISSNAFHKNVMWLTNIPYKIVTGNLTTKGKSQNALN